MLYLFNSCQNFHQKRSVPSTSTREFTGKLMDLKMHALKLTIIYAHRKILADIRIS
jgi:hypothetical protein